MSEDSSVLKCRHCGETKKRFLDGRYPKSVNKRWCDENGKEWSGHTCSDCHADKVKLRKQLKKKNKLNAN